MKSAIGLMMMSALLPGADTVHEFTMNAIDGASTPLSQFKGKTVLFVNVASQCGYTPQYRGLEAKTGRGIQWNFTKILVSKDGNVNGHFEPNVDPEAPGLQVAIEWALRE